MRVEQLMTTKPEYIDADASIREAALRLEEQGRGFTPVADHEKLVGVLTDRDIALRTVTNGKTADDKVKTIMSGKVLYCYANDDIRDVLQNMNQQHVQRLVVLNNPTNKDFVGVISLSDIAEHCENKSDPDLMHRVINCCRKYH